MRKPVIIYALCVFCLLVFVGGSVLAPVLALSDPARAAWIYGAYAPTCHQKISRALCLFKGADGSVRFGDCLPQGGAAVGNDAHVYSVRAADGSVGYPIAVCARDVGIYLFMLLGALAYPLFFRIDSKTWMHPAILVLALVPMGIDGGVQLLSAFPSLGIAYESTNALRLLTGALAGFVCSLYVIPILNRMFG